MLLEYYYPNYKLDFVSFWLVKISENSSSLRGQQPLVAPKGKHPPPLLAIFLKLWRLFFTCTKTHVFYPPKIIWLSDQKYMNIF